MVSSLAVNNWSWCSLDYSTTFDPTNRSSCWGNSVWTKSDWPDKTLALQLVWQKEKTWLISPWQETHNILITLKMADKCSCEPWPWNWSICSCFSTSNWSQNISMITVSYRHVSFANEVLSFTVWDHPQRSRKPEFRDGVAAVPLRFQEH